MREATKGRVGSELKSRWWKAAFASLVTKKGGSSVSLSLQSGTKPEERGPLGGQLSLCLGNWDLATFEPQYHFMSLSPTFSDASDTVTRTRRLGSWTNNLLQKRGSQQKTPGPNKGATAGGKTTSHLARVSSGGLQPVQVSILKPFWECWRQ